MRVLGIDEAGRGCVLGDLVVGGFVVEGVDDLALVAAGAGDSKAMTPARRLEVRTALVELGTADVRCIAARAIDAGNLNTLEEDAIVALVREHRPDLVIIDALGHPSALPRIQARLMDRVGPDIQARWILEPKADANHPVVGAASVFAKTTRDALLDEVRAAWGEVGSGYPSDPKTKQWLAAWARTGKPWPDFVRTRWQTVTALSQQSLLG